MSQESEARRVVAANVERFGALHTVVNVAGIRVDAPLADARTEDWQRIIGVNLLATTTAVRPRSRICARAAEARS